MSNSHHNSNFIHKLSWGCIFENGIVPSTRCLHIDKLWNINFSMCTLAIAYLDPGIQEWRLRLFWYLEPVGTCSRFGTCEIKDLPWWDAPNWLARLIETRFRSAFLYSLKSKFVSSYISLASSGSEDSETLFFILVCAKVRMMS